MTVAPKCDRMTATGQDTDDNNNLKNLIKLNKNNNSNVQIYKMDNMQNSTNTIYKIDNSVCSGMLGANLKCNKYVC